MGVVHRLKTRSTTGLIGHAFAAALDAGVRGGVWAGVGAGGWAGVAAAMALLLGIVTFLREPTMPRILT
jgi:hypothetical protein